MTDPETFRCIMCSQEFADDKRTSIGEEYACPGCFKTLVEECDAIVHAYDTDADRGAWTVILERFPQCAGVDPEPRLITTCGRWRLDYYSDFGTWAIETAGNNPKSGTTGYRYESPEDAGVPKHLAEVCTAFSDAMRALRVARGRIAIKGMRESADALMAQVQPAMDWAPFAELVAACEEEFVGDVCDDEPDDEPVASSYDITGQSVPSFLTFGMIRRAKNALPAVHRRAAEATGSAALNLHRVVAGS